MWYFRFIVHRRSGQMNQDNPVQIEEMEVLKRDVWQIKKKGWGRKEDRGRKSKSSPPEEWQETCSL